MITRFGGHFVGDPQLYRSKEEVSNVRKSMDCIGNFQARVLADNSLTAAEMAAIDHETAQLIDAAVAEGIAAPLPPVSDLYTNVYSNY
jgi:pyruvate dehydrogenase E1 component alpha subunit